MPVDKSEFNQQPKVTKYKLTNQCGQLSVCILDYGATIANILFKDNQHVERDLVLGFDDLDGYQSKVLRNPYFGATIGRVANRIGNAVFELDGRRFELIANNKPNHLHSGGDGYDKRIWSLVAEGPSSITLQYTSADGEAGYPGALQVQVQFSVTESNELILDYSAHLLENSPKTIINMTNHSYFNLSGAYNADASKILDHKILMDASKYLEVNENLIPTGQIVPTKATALDFHEKPFAVRDRVAMVKPNGYDHCYVLEDEPSNFIINPCEVRRAAQVWSPLTGIKMTFSTTEPGFQLYTGAKIVEGHRPKTTQTTNESVTIGSFSGFCLEAQRFPDAINRNEWQKQVILGPDQQYKQVSVYKFELSENLV